MRLFVDADACPVVPQCLEEAGRAGVPVTLVCDQAHRMERPGAETVTVSQGADSADFARRARVLHQDGHEYTPENIDGLLAFRHEARKLRRAGGRTRGPAKRTPAQDEAFRALLARVLAGEK